MATTTANLNLWSVLSESKRIINAHSRHFLALSVIFLLPLSFTLIVSPTVLHLLTHSNSPTIHILLRIAQTNSFNFPFPFPILLLFHLLLFILSLAAVATITHSVLHGFFGRPVKLLSAVTSVISSFLPLLVTTILSHLIFFSVSIPIRFLSLLGPSVDFDPIILIAAIILLQALIFFLLHLRISWNLASVVAVMENSYGIHALRRSAALMKRMTITGAYCFAFFTSLELIMMWSGSFLAAVSSDSGSWKDWAFIVQIVLTSTVMTVLMLYKAAANTVLYIYCKAVNGELSEIAEEFASQYVSLPFDDGKVPHVVSVVSV